MNKASYELGAPPSRGESRENFAVDGRGSSEDWPFRSGGFTSPSSGRPAIHFSVPSSHDTSIQGNSALGYDNAEKLSFCEQFRKGRRHGQRSRSRHQHDDKTMVIETSTSASGGHEKAKHNGASFLKNVYLTTRTVILSSYVNFLLVFVPIGIAVGNIPQLVGPNGIASGPAIVFAMNCVAIVPLAGLLSLATETMAARRGPAIGALMNITFGNGVELIIFIIALAKDEIRIVQASLLGSILANLLLILGMCFLIGGLRFREQVYNPTVTQTMACLLSLSVISLVLPTAFHISFQDNTLAKRQDLVISRITSIVLLAVYLLYLFFQLKTHAYMYKSLPQHMIDQESQPGPVAAFLNESDMLDTASQARTNRESLRETSSRRVMNFVTGRGNRRRKAGSVSSSGSTLVHARTSSSVGSAAPFGGGGAMFSSNLFNEKRDEEEASGHMSKKRRRPHEPTVFETNRGSESFNIRPPQYHQNFTSDFDLIGPRLRLSINRSITPTEAPQPAVRVGVNRTHSLPTRLASCGTPAAAPCQLHAPCDTTTTQSPTPSSTLSTRAATTLLLVSTGLVAYCAELMVSSMSAMLSPANGKPPIIGEAFIGLIVLPVVGNAAEHVTALTVAVKNKMDLAIAVAVGSSIQIALFVTPSMVMLGWALQRDMTLRFTLFETVCLFLATFIANFLVLDGRSNYLEGALLLAAYVIIAVVAFYYPSVADSVAAVAGAQ